MTHKIDHAEPVWRANARQALERLKRQQPSKEMTVRTSVRDDNRKPEKEKP